MGSETSAQPSGSWTEKYSPPLARGWSSSAPFPLPPPPVVDQRRCPAETLGPSGGSQPVGVAPTAAPGNTNTLGPLPKPEPIAFPSLKGIVGPAGQPSLPDCCPAGNFFGDPPTRNRSTSGVVLSTTDVARRRQLLAMAVSQVAADRPLSAANLQNWLNGRSATMVMASAPFLAYESGTTQFLARDARNKFTTAITKMLQDRNDPHGALLPDALTLGAMGPVRFLQFEDAVDPLTFGSIRTSDLHTAVGRYNVHSAVWVRAVYRGKETTTNKDKFDVQFLRWCAQAYDVYDWNADATAITPFPLSDAQYSMIEKMGDLGAGAFLTKALFGPTLTVNDRWLRDLEVSGGGRAFLVRSEAFEAPRAASAPLSIIV